MTVIYEGLCPDQDALNEAERLNAKIKKCEKDSNNG